MRLLAGIACAVCFVGCGDEDKVGKLPDAPPASDAAIDASTMGPVSLAIFEGTTPRVGIRVIFQAADSTVVSDTTTGTDGKASAMMEAGGFVTAIDPFSGGAQGVATTNLRTYAGVKPGDQLRMFEPASIVTTIDVNVTLPIEPNAASYTVSTNCMFDAVIGPDPAGGNPTGTLQLPGCAATSNLLVIANDVSANPLSSFYKQSVALVDGGTLDLSGDTFAAVPDSTFTYSNLPAATTSVGIFGVRSTALGKIYSFTALGSVSAGGGVVTVKVPPVANGVASTLTTIYGAQYTQHVIGEWGPISTAYALDAAGLLLPDFSAPATLDAAAHAIKWTPTGGSVQPDFAHVRAFLNRDVGGSTQMWNWEIVTPSGTQAVLPVLPNNSPFNPMTGDFGSYLVTTVKVPGGYDAVRENALAIDNLQEIAVGAAGKASFAILVEPEARVRPRETAVLRGFTKRAR